MSSAGSSHLGCKRYGAGHSLDRDQGEGAGDGRRDHALRTGADFLPPDAGSVAVPGYLQHGRDVAAGRLRPEEDAHHDLLREVHRGRHDDGGADAGGRRRGVRKPERAVLCRVARDPLSRDQWGAFYDAEIRYADEHVGLLLEFLRERGLYQNTLVIVTADHGEMFGEHGAWGHNGILYESEHPTAGALRQCGPAARFSATPSAPGAIAPLLGEHTDEILSELGYDFAGITALREESVVA